MRPIGTSVTFQMVSKSSDGLDQPVTTDVYTVTLTSISAEELVKKNAGESYNEVIVTDTAERYFKRGTYITRLQVTQAGTYDVLITMENAFTDADPDISTIVGEFP